MITDPALLPLFELLVKGKPPTVTIPLPPETEPVLSSNLAITCFPIFTYSPYCTV